ncbi:MAG: hypothetical protein ACRYFX_30520 [Janthinobacterium lividum]
MATAAQAQEARKIPVHTTTTISTTGCHFQVDGWYDDGVYSDYFGRLHKGPEHHHLVFSHGGPGCDDFTANLKVAPAGAAGDDDTNSGGIKVEGTLTHDDTGETEDVASSPELRSMLSELISQYYHE